MKWSLYSYPITAKSQGYQFTCSTAPHVSLRQSHIPSVSSERHTETPIVKTHMYDHAKSPHDCKDYEASGIGNNAYKHSGQVASLPPPSSSSPSSSPTSSSLTPSSSSFPSPPPSSLVSSSYT